MAEVPGAMHLHRERARHIFVADCFSVPVGVVFCVNLLAAPHRFFGIRWELLLLRLGSSEPGAPSGVSRIFGCKATRKEAEERLLAGATPSETTQQLSLASR
jgi:hypothetical protein